MEITDKERLDFLENNCIDLESDKCIITLTIWGKGFPKTYSAGTKREVIDNAIMAMREKE